MTIFEKTGMVISLGLILVLLCLIFFSQNGILDYKSLKVKETVIQDQTRTLDLANEKLENEIQSLKTDMEYIKHVAKHEHDMAEEDELIFKDKTVQKGKHHESGYQNP
jgi:cell division protein FtsB